MEWRCIPRNLILLKSFANPKPLNLALWCVVVWFLHGYNGSKSANLGVKIGKHCKILIQRQKWCFIFEALKM